MAINSLDIHPSWIAACLTTLLETTLIHFADLSNADLNHADLANANPEHTQFKDAAMPVGRKYDPQSHTAETLIKKSAGFVGDIH